MRWSAVEWNGVQWTSGSKDGSLGGYTHVAVRKMSQWRLEIPKKCRHEVQMTLQLIQSVGKEFRLLLCFFS